MDPDTEIEVEIFPMIRIYKSGRVERLFSTNLLPAGVDPATGVDSKDVVIDPATGVSARLYLPPGITEKQKLPVLVYYHGGGFCVESPFSSTFHPYLNLLTAKARVLAVSVNYRLAPEHPLPAAYDDSWAALRWVAGGGGGDAWLAEHGDLERLFVAGDSAGANIAYNVAVKAGVAGGVKLEGVALVHPHIWGKEAVGAEFSDAANKRMMEQLWRLACPDTEGDDDPRVNPLVEGAAGPGCRRAAVFVAEEDRVTPRAVALYEKLRRSGGWGGAVELVVTVGEGHDFHIFNPGCEKAAEKMEKFAAFLNAN